MKIVDTNVLVHAINPLTDEHPAARGWLDGALSGGSSVGFAWLALVGFLRVVTGRGIFEEPLSSADANDVVGLWLAQSSAHVLHPTLRHHSVLADLLQAAGRAGNLVNDAHLAALAVEHRAEIVTFDSDFSRFPGVRWERPDPDVLA